MSIKLNQSGLILIQFNLLTQLHDEYIDMEAKFTSVCVRNFVAKFTPV